MDSKKLYTILDKERRLYSTPKTEFSQMIGISKSRFNTLMNTLYENKTNGGVAFNTVAPILKKLGYEIKISKVKKNQIKSLDD